MFSKAKNFFLIFGDIFTLYLSLYLTLVSDQKEIYPSNFLAHIVPFSLLFLVWLLLFYIFGLDDISLLRNNLEFWLKFGQALGAALISGIIFFYFLPLFKISPKTNLFVALLIFAFLFFVWRRLLYKILGLPQFLERVIILGSSPQHLEIARKIKKNPQIGFQLIGLLEEKKLPQNLENFLKRKNVQVVILSKNILSQKRFSKKLYQCLPLRINVVDFTSFYEKITGKIPLSEIDRIWFLEKRLFWQEKRITQFSKRAFDLGGAFLILGLSLPLWPIIALAIKLEDKGPVFYKQERVGRENKKFWLIKFRSMKQGAEKEKPVWAKEEDPRVTRTGRILRRLHLDELPQMLNVLRGDISLVGPRPERPEFVKKLEKEIPHYHLRHLIKPGFTGWAQIKFRYSRSVMDSHEKFQYDLYYIKNRSLILDIGILLKTFQLFFKRKSSTIERQ